MRIPSGGCVLLLLATSVTVGQPSFPSYYRQNDFLLASPGTFKFGLNEYDNPALPSLLREPDVLFLWLDQTAKWDSFNRWGAFAAADGVENGLAEIIVLRDDSPKVI